MKTFILLALVFAITAAFAFAAVQAPVAGANAFADLDRYTTNMEWNNSFCSLGPTEAVAFLIAPIGPPQPLVNWNS